MPEARWKTSLAAAVMVFGLVAIVVMALTMFVGGFTKSEPVIVTAPRAGLVMDTDAKVKMRGVQVGKVASISYTGDGAELKLDMDPAMMSQIPANATVQIDSTTVFGAKFVNFVVPEAPSSNSLQPGTVISADNVTVEFNTLFQHLTQVLDQVQPEKLNATLGALASALRGRGEDLGILLEQSDQYLKTMNPTLPQVEYDIKATADVSNIYADTAQDLLKIVDNATGTSGSIVEEQANLDLLLMNVTGLANTGNAVLRENEANAVTALDTLTHTTTLLQKYSPELTCFITGLNAARIKFEPMTGTGKYSSIMLSTNFMLGAEAYKAPGELPKVAASGGPNCYGLPDFDPKKDGAAPFVVANTGAKPYVPSEQARLSVPTIFRFLFDGYTEADQ
ncbi:phospholipid/cholesterol/gamma-HCH transport system substrate-binding protein [Rhodococcus sp. LBL1]|nr:phospholipid/cholesterol/gamma-HCH transport system substrate-binding protein [Rhodococcus sp. LBL1]MDH6682014.1 phospholipid/cholesterol/gamma-HCH transport system substrate-binding protein [Rhodococcus sp. LBL2]